MQIQSQSETPDKTISSMNLNTVAFKNQGDLAFVWEGLLYVLDGKTGEVRQLTYSGKAQHPAWSHDGEWLAFISSNSPSGNSGQLWLVRRDGEQAHQVRGVPELSYVQDISWSPMANILAVSSQEGLWLVPVDGKPQQVQNARNFTDASWSPDGKFLTFSGNNLPANDPKQSQDRRDALHTINVDNGQIVRHIIAPPDTGIKKAGWWSNGKGLVYWLDPSYSASIAADGLGLWSLRLGDSQPKLLSTGLVHRNWLSLLSSGQLLMVTGGGRIVWADKSLTISNLETGTTKVLPNPKGNVAIDPSLSPDGKKIAFVAAKNLGNSVWGFSKPEELENWIATRTLWIENVDGSGAHPLKDAGTGVYQPVWSKDGNRIMYVRDNSLWIIGANRENPVKILGPFSDWEKDRFGFYGYIWHDDFAWFQPFESNAANVVESDAEKAPAAAKMGVPILLIQPNKIPESVQQYFSGKSISKVYIVGDETIVSDSTAKQLPFPCERVYGQDRYKTNQAAITKFQDILNSNLFYVATGQDYADALTGSVLAAKNNAPILFMKDYPRQTLV